MSRLIDADKQLVRLYRLNLTCEDVIRRFLITADKVDAVEVVRCKECKHYGTSLNGVPTQGYCKLTEWQTRHDNDYCSMGVRKCQE